MTWHVHYAGVRVGVRAPRRRRISGNGAAASIRGAIPATIGTAVSFEAARTAFEAAWRHYLPKRSEADFEEWRQDAEWHAAKYARCTLNSSAIGGPS